MRIDAYNAINQIKPTSKVNKTAGSKKTSDIDKFEISQAGKDFQTAKKAVSEAPDIRTDLINDIRQRINNGTYDVSDEDVADKILEGIFS